MVSNKEAANALIKLKTSKKSKSKPKPKTPLVKELSSVNKIAIALIGDRSKKPKNNNNKKVASNFLQSFFTPRKNTNKK